MFFRIWFLYLMKLAAIAWVVFFVAFTFGRWPWLQVVGRVALWIIGILSVSGALLAVPILIWPRRLRCPLCASIGELVLCGKYQPGVECPQCGVVYAKHVVWSFQLCILEEEDFEDDADDDEDDTENGPPGN